VRRDLSYVRTSGALPTAGVGGSASPAAAAGCQLFPISAAAAASPPRYASECS
jgi:hypothetical protein